MDTQRRASRLPQKHVVYVCAAFCCLLWGGAYPAIKSGYDLFQIATDIIPSKIVLLVIVLLRVGCCCCSRCFGVNRLVGFRPRQLLS